MASVPTSSPPDAADSASPSDTTLLPESAPAPLRCANCDTRLRGDFCHACGQKHLDAVTFRYLLRKAKDLLLDLDSGLPKTVLAVLKNPGEVARRYVDGERKTFVGPLTMFAVSTALAFLVYSFFEAAYVDLLVLQVNATWEAMGLPPEKVFEDNPVFNLLGIGSVVELASHTFEIQKALQSYLMILILLPIVGLMRLLMGTRTVAEISVFELYVVSQCNLLSAVCALVLFPVYPSAILGFSMFLQVGLQAYAAPAFYPAVSPAKARMLAPLCYLGGMLAFLIGFGIIGLVIGIASALLFA
jgi:hypothetical protein